MFREEAVGGNETRRRWVKVRWRETNVKGEIKRAGFPRKTKLAKNIKASGAPVRHRFRRIQRKKTSHPTTTHVPMITSQ